MVRLNRVCIGYPFKEKALDEKKVNYVLIFKKVKPQCKMINFAVESIRKKVTVRLILVLLQDRFVFVFNL